jgi:hypothetical protein
MLALVLAAQLVGGPILGGSLAVETALPRQLNAPGSVAPIPAACRLGRYVARATPGEARALRLGDLPPAHEEIAVYRTVAGCAVPLIVRDDVEGRR